MLRNFKVFNGYVCSVFAAVSVNSEMFRPILSHLFDAISAVQRIVCNNLPCWFYTFFATQVPLLQFLQACWEWQKLN